MLLMKSVAQELAPFFIRVNSIAPGAIRTPSWQGPTFRLETFPVLIDSPQVSHSEDFPRVDIATVFGLLLG